MATTAATTKLSGLAFKELFSSFDADLPGTTLVVMGISNFFVSYWWAIFGTTGFGIWFFFYT